MFKDGNIIHVDFVATRNVVKPAYNVQTSGRQVIQLTNDQIANLGLSTYCGDCTLFGVFLKGETTPMTIFKIKPKNKGTD